MCAPVPPRRRLEHVDGKGKDEIRTAIEGESGGERSLQTVLGGSVVDGLARVDQRVRSLKGGHRSSDNFILEQEWL